MYRGQKKSLIFNVIAHIGRKNITTNTFIVYSRALFILYFNFDRMMIVFIQKMMCLGYSSICVQLYKAYWRSSDTLYFPNILSLNYLSGTARNFPEFPLAMEKQNNSYINTLQTVQNGECKLNRLWAVHSTMYIVSFCNSFTYCNQHLCASHKQLLCFLCGQAGTTEIRTLESRVQVFEKEAVQDQREEIHCYGFIPRFDNSFVFE